MSRQAADEHGARETGQRRVAVAASRLRREFGSETALESLDLSVSEGSIYGFIGPSGSGKTTAVRLLIGIDRPTSGTAEVLGSPSSSLDRGMRARIGYMPQESVQFPNLSVRENMSFVASLYGLTSQRKERIKAALERTELYEDRRKPVRALSSGMRRRLALSAALVHDPDVLFLDEPTAGIDPVLRRKLWDQFDELRMSGTTFFVTTQYVGEAAYCDRVGVLAKGALVAEDTPDELRRRALGGDVLELVPSTPFDAALTAGLAEQEGVRDVQRLSGGAKVRVVVDAAAERLPDVQEWCTAQGLEATSLREDRSSFDDVFAALMGQEDGDEPVAA